jgi:hypothetical protein
VNNRFETDFGDDGLKSGQPVIQCNLRAFDARYRFQDRTWSITVWARNWDEANRYAKEHGLQIDGQVDSVMEA